MKDQQLEWEGEQTPKPPYRSTLFDWGEALVVSITAVILVFTFCCRLIGVVGTSMVPTLQNQDQLLISNLFYEPEYGDIVVLTKRSFLDEPIVKRVIATEGQTVDIDFSTGTVTVDGQVLQEDYIAEPTTLMGDMVFPCTVPENCVFVMGDNRNRSSDSRIAALGMVDERYILGRVIWRVLPVSGFGMVA